MSSGEERGAKLALLSCLPESRMKPADYLQPMDKERERNR
jgi:hypothetical protein